MLLAAGHEQFDGSTTWPREGRPRAPARRGQHACRTAGELPDDLTAVALVLFADEVRPDAADTVDYFLRENVRPKVISGDNPVTVAAIARRCNVPDADRYVDARDLPDDPAALAESPTPRPCSVG